VAGKLKMKYLLLGCCMLLFALANGCQKSSSVKMTERVVIAGESFNLEVASDSYARLRGLMERENIDEDGGMLFIYGYEQAQQFWMGYCLFDIDVIFLDANGVVTATHEMKFEKQIGEGESEIDYRARLADYDSVLPAQYAIELRGGWLAKLHINNGDRLALDVGRLKHLVH